MLRDTDPAHILLSLAISLESRGHMRPRSPGVGTSWGSAWLCVLQLSSWGGRTAPGAVGQHLGLGPTAHGEAGGAA